MRRLLDHDPLSGITQWFEYDSVTDKSKIITTQDVEPYLNRNRELYKEESYKKQGIKNEMLHVASIPNIVIEKWLKEDGIDIYNKDHWQKVRAKLNSPEYRYLRTTQGRV